MITIKTADGQSLNLQVDLRLSIEETSVFESKQGSYSLPLSLPYTHHNATVLGLPSNIARKGAFTTSVDVIISVGVWVRHAILEVGEARKGESIECTLFLKESPFYSKIEGVDLPDLFKDKAVDMFAHLSGQDKILALIQHMQHVSVGQEVADYYVFPVCAEIQDFEKKDQEGSISVTSTWQRFKILNMQITPDANNEFGAVANYNGRDYYTLAGSALDYDEDGVSYVLPTGYGITPFLKFTYILRTIFAHFGYQLAESIFDTDISFKKMCLLNNTIDAIVGGVVDYSQLVPDVTVSEFFEFVENSFGCEFVIDEMFKTAIPRFWNDVLNSKSNLNLSHKFEDYPQLQYKEPQAVKLTIARDNKATTPTTFASYQELFAKHGAPIYKPSYRDTVDQMQRDRVMDGDFFYFFGDTLTYMIFTDGYMGPRHVVEIDTLDYIDSALDMGVDDRNTKMQAVAMQKIATGGVTGMRVDYKVDMKWLPKSLRDNISAQISDQYTTQDRLVANMPYIDTYRHLNSVMQKKQTKEGTEIVSEEKEAKVDLAITPCFYYGLADYDVKMPNLNKTVFGTTHRYSNRGQAWGTFDLTTKSLFERFWQKYDSIIRSSYHTISGPAHLSVSELMNLDFDKQYLLDNQTVLPTAIQYEVSDHGVEVTNLEVKTTKVYE